MAYRESMAAQGGNKVRALIVDDEDLGRRVLRTLLAHDDDIEIVGEAGTASEAERQIAIQRPDLVFMDIEIPGGSGIEVLRKATQPLPYVIFVTAHPEFALPAFELEAVDYLVKPVQRPRFNGSVLRAKQRIVERRVAGLALQIAGATGKLNGTRDSDPSAGAAYPDHLTIRVRRRLIALDIGDITWIQGASQYSRVHTRSGEYLLSRTLASLECELDPQRFFRIHRSAIVNVRKVKELHPHSNGEYFLILDNGAELKLSRSYKEVVARFL